MAMVQSETTGLLKVLYDVMLEALENEKLKHPETYETAVRMAEKFRKTAIHFTGATEDFPEFPK